MEQALRLGYLRECDQLPRVKDVVAGLAINPNTVLKAYRELEHRGLVAGRRGLDTFVAGTLGRVGLREQATFFDLTLRGERQPLLDRPSRPIPRSPSSTSDLAHVSRCLAPAGAGTNSGR